MEMPFQNPVRDVLVRHNASLFTYSGRQTHEFGSNGKKPCRHLITVFHQFVFMFDRRISLLGTLFWTSFNVYNSPI